MQTHEREKDSRDSIILMLLILLLGFICIIVTSGWALRFSQSWKLPANMRSNLNPDSDFLTGRPSGFIEPLDPAILTPPDWINVFLTPGSTFLTRTPQPNTPQASNTSAVTQTNAPVFTITTAPTNTLVPTNTLIYAPPPVATATSTKKPKPPAPIATSTSTATLVPLPSADLQITKTDGVTTYTPGGTLTYTIAVTNNGTSNVTGAAVSDNFPAQISSVTWTCVSAGGATCTASGNSNINDTVNVPVGGSATYTINVTIGAGATGNLTNTASVSVPAGYTDPNPSNNAATDTDTPPAADLRITKTDNATDYAANISVQYIIVASNSGPSNVLGATVADAFSSNLTGIAWSCVSSGGASCTASSSGNINDTVNLPAGGSVTYTVSATVIASPSGPLSNTATITAPAGVTDPAPGNNSATDTDQLIVTDPPGNIGSSPDGSSTNIPAGTYITLQLGSSVVVGGHAGYDLVYYSDPAAPILQMDLVILQIGDGRNWYTIFNWGNGSPDANTDINPGDCPSETDNCVITPPPTNSPGVSIQLDGVVPNGTYPYVRIFSPSAPPDSGDGVDVDAITVLP